MSEMGETQELPALPALPAFPANILLRSWGRRRCLLALLQPLQQLNLPRVIKIVRGDAAEREGDRIAAAHALVERAARQRPNHLAQPAMLVLEHTQVVAPRPAVDRKPVGSLQPERSARDAGEAPADGVLPVRRM